MESFSVGGNKPAFHFVDLCRLYIMTEFRDGWRDKHYEGRGWARPPYLIYGRSQVSHMTKQRSIPSSSKVRAKIQCK